MKTTLLIALSLLFSPALLRPQTAPKFEDYPIAVYTGRTHQPKWIRRGPNGEWRDQLGKLVDPPEINFAGRYFVSVHSCGTACRYYTLTDLSTGCELKLLRDFGAAEPPPKPDEGYPFVIDLVTRADSRLLVAQYRIDGLGGEDRRERSFILAAGKLSALGGTRRPCTQY